VAILSEEEAAELLGQSVRTLQGWRSKGLGPAFRKIGRNVEYVSEDVEEWRQAQRQVPTSAAERRRLGERAGKR